MKHQHNFLSLAVLLASAYGLNLHGASSFQFEFTPYRAAEETPSVLVGVLRHGDLTEPVSVEVTSQDMTATAGVDYVATSLTLEFAEGEEIQTFRLPLLNDGVEEPGEIFRLMLENPSEGSRLTTPYAATIALRDNDPGVQFTWMHFLGYERDGQITVTVERGNDGGLSPLTVDYATSDLTAEAGQAYTAISGTLEFAAGEMAKAIIIPVADDAEVESRGEFPVTLSNSTGPGGLGGNTTTALRIHDTTGHEPRRFGKLISRSISGPTPYRPHKTYWDLPLWGCRSGSSTACYELYGVEASADLRAWQPSGWVAWSPAVGDPLPIHHSFQWKERSGGIGWSIPKQFFRLTASPFTAAWPPPSGLFAYRPSHWRNSYATYAIGYNEPGSWLPGRTGGSIQGPTFAFVAAWRGSHVLGWKSRRKSGSRPNSARSLHPISDSGDPTADRAP